MAKYDITYSCGHEDRITLFGPSRNRERRIEWLESQGLCEDCFRAKLENDRKIAAEKAAEAAKEAGLPALEGSPKQVAWAERIREEASKVNWHLDHRKPEIQEACERLRLRFLSIRKASWWIENRETGYTSRGVFRLAGIDPNTKFVKDNPAEITRAVEIIDEGFAEHTSKPTLDPVAEIIQAEATAEATIRPESPTTETIAEIHLDKDLVTVSFPERDESFRKLVKYQLGYSWDETRRLWSRKITALNGPAKDRAVELGVTLLSAGFPVRCFNEDIRTAILAGDYAQECRRWVQVFTSGKHQGKFAIWWHRDEGDFYNAARKLRGSSWDRPDVVVPREQFEAVLAFAERYEFGITPKALQAMDQAAAVKDASIVAPAETTRPKRSVKPRPAGNKPEPLPVPENVTVDDELRD